MTLVARVTKEPSGRSWGGGCRGEGPWGASALGQVRPPTRGSAGLCFLLLLQAQPQPHPQPSTLTLGPSSPDPRQHSAGLHRTCAPGRTPPPLPSSYLSGHPGVPSAPPGPPAPLSLQGALATPCPASHAPRCPHAGGPRRPRAGACRAQGPLVPPADPGPARRPPRSLLRCLGGYVHSLKLGNTHKSKVHSHHCIHRRLNKDGLRGRLL